jgi:hypothetical protein
MRLALVALALAGCEILTHVGPTKENTSALCVDGVDNDGDGKIDCEDPDCADLPVCDAQPNNLDVLFVIDNSSTMAANQNALASGLDAFFGEFSQSSVPPNINVGVVSTDVGAGGYSINGCDDSVTHDGTLQLPSGCMTDDGASFLWDLTLPDGTPISNHKTQSLAAAVGCFVRLGGGGCDRLQPLEAMQRALENKGTVNQGFLRPDALLAVIFVTDGDDCSVSDASVFDPSMIAMLGPSTRFRCTRWGVICDGQTVASPGSYGSCAPLREPNTPYLRDPQTYVDYLTGSLKRDRNLVFVGVVAGDASPFVVDAPGGDSVLDPSCTSAGGAGAVPPVRLGYVAGQLNSAVVRICAGDLTNPLMMIAQGILAHLRSNP